MGDTVAIREIIGDWSAWQIIDVRSPGEFAAGHIPGAVNIPLFTDEERARVGTIYTPVSYTHLDVYKRQELVGITS